LTREERVFGKLAVLIVSAGLIACALLAARQMRTQAAYELAQSRLRSVRIDENVSRVRAVIAARVSPERVLEMAARVNPMKPLADNRPAVRAAAPPQRVARNEPARRRTP
jgi:hypothetical protein